MSTMSCGRYPRHPNALHSHCCSWLMPNLHPGEVSNWMPNTMNHCHCQPLTTHMSCILTCFVRHLSTIKFKHLIHPATSPLTVSQVHSIGHCWPTSRGEGFKLWWQQISSQKKTDDSWIFRFLDLNQFNIHLFFKAFWNACNPFKDIGCILGSGRMTFPTLSSSVMFEPQLGGRTQKPWDVISPFASFEVVWCPWCNLWLRRRSYRRCFCIALLICTSDLISSIGCTSESCASYQIINSSCLLRMAWIETSSTST